MEHQHNDQEMANSPTLPQTHLFTLRVWEEQLGAGQSEWRGRVQEITTGETHYFRDWPGLISVLSQLLTAS